MKNLVGFFDEYVQCGLQPIAIYKGDKCPIGKLWNQNWSVQRWRTMFEQSNDLNMGILLGNIVDVEGDTDKANENLSDMIGDLSHPMFKSSKSIHHIFLNPDENLTRKVMNGIEFRAYTHQSVVPPSIHNSGNKYEWMSDYKLPIPQMPRVLYEYYISNLKPNSNSKSKKIVCGKRKLKQGHIKTTCKICNQSFFIHKKRLILEVRSFQKMNLPWMCHGCREISVKEMCREIRKDLNSVKN
jgi:hypothetical protein